jgi:hypothetical protein
MATETCVCACCAGRAVEISEFDAVVVNQNEPGYTDASKAFSDNAADTAKAYDADSKSGEHTLSLFAPNTHRCNL